MHVDVHILHIPLTLMSKRYDLYTQATPEVQFLPCRLTSVGHTHLKSTGHLGMTSTNMAPLTLLVLLKVAIQNAFLRFANIPKKVHIHWHVTTYAIHITRNEVNKDYGFIKQ